MLDLSWFCSHSKVTKKRRYQSESVQSVDLEAKMGQPLSEFKSIDPGSEPNSPMFAFGLDDDDPSPTGGSNPMAMAEAKSDNSLNGRDLNQRLSSSMNSSENDLVALNAAKARMIADEAKFCDDAARSKSPLSSTHLKPRTSSMETDDGDDDQQAEKFKDSLSLRARRHFSKSNPITVDTKVAKNYSSVATLQASNPNTGTSGGSLQESYVLPRGGGRREGGAGSPPAHLSLNLPPIDPQTPSLKSAKKTYRSGVSLLREVDNTDTLSPMQLTPEGEKRKLSSPSLPGRTYSSSSDIGAEEKQTR